MSYDNASPKALKFLVSNGDLLDDTGNVISHSDSLKDMYDKAVPEVKKYLLSDGSVVDEDGNTIIKNDYFKTVYEQAVPKVAKYLHADGTIDENAGGGSGSNLQNNKSVTISQNGTIVINPDNNYDGMKKVTAEVSVASEIDFTSKVWAYNKSGSEMFIALDINNKPLPTGEYSFESILNKVQENGKAADNSFEPVKFSKHAENRLYARNIELTQDQMNRLNQGKIEAGEKGIHDSLILVDQLAFIVNIPNNTVVTAMDQTENKSNVFTNIDGAVIA